MILDTMLRKIRTYTALISIALITLLFLDFTGSLHAWLGWLAKIQLLPALLAVNLSVILFLVVLTLIGGRIYCSVICPLGIFQDIISHLHRSKKHKARFSYTKEHRLLRYGFLGLLIVALLLGIGSVVQLLAPYSAYGRIASQLFAPAYRYGNNLLALLAERWDSYAIYSVEVWTKNVAALAVAVLTLLLVGILAWKHGRRYCNTVCPVGTLLGLLSRHALFRIEIDTTKCVSCMQCAHNCKSECIDIKHHKIDYSRCVTCMDCIDKCHTDAISYRLRSRKPSPHPTAKEEQKVESPDRRKFLGMTGILAATALSAQGRRLNRGLAVLEQKKAPRRLTPVTPPGSWGIEEMKERCTGCQLCVSACPNHVLRPSGGLMTLLQPVSSFENGYCRPECTRCSEVCPTGAIRPITRIEKSSIQTGHAVFIPQNCLSLNDGVRCTVCARNCPAGAIRLVKSDPDNPRSPRIPSIDEERCIGCGACEYLCPSRPFSAIYVEGHEHHRTL